MTGRLRSLNELGRLSPLTEALREKLRGIRKPTTDDAS